MLGQKKMRKSKKNEIYKRNDQAVREQMFERLARDIRHSVINITPPRNKDEIKKIRKDHGLSGADAAVICGVSRKTWTMWENYKKDNKGESKETYPSDWQWGWFLLAINKHPELRLVENNTQNN